MDDVQISIVIYMPLKYVNNLHLLCSRLNARKRGNKWTDPLQLIKPRTVLNRETNCDAAQLAL